MIDPFAVVVKAADDIALAQTLPQVRSQVDLLKTHVELMAERVRDSDERAARAEKEKLEAVDMARRHHERVVSLEREVEELKKQLAPDPFANAYGAKFLPERDGRFHEVVYCPECKTSTFKHVSGGYGCKCGWISTFSRAFMPRILAELNGDPVPEPPPAKAPERPARRQSEWLRTSMRKPPW